MTPLEHLIAAVLAKHLETAADELAVALKDEIEERAMERATDLVAELRERINQDDK
jgi:hypothetical protein